MGLEIQRESMEVQAETARLGLRYWVGKRARFTPDHIPMDVSGQSGP